MWRNPRSPEAYGGCKGVREIDKSLVNLRLWIQLLLHIRGVATPNGIEDAGTGLGVLLHALKILPKRHGSIRSIEMLQEVLFQGLDIEVGVPLQVSRRPVAQFAEVGGFVIRTLMAEALH